MGVLCDRCRQRLPKQDSLLHEQIVDCGAVDASTWLVDRWGRPHPVMPPCIIGREGTGIAIYARGISRRHAVLDLRDDTMTVRDLGSRNGTTVNGAPVDAAVALEPGDLVQLGHVPMLYAEGRLTTRVLSQSSSFRTAPITMDFEDDHWRATTPPGSLTAHQFQLLEPAAGDGGVLVIGGSQRSLSPAQLTLLRLLAEARIDDDDTARELRGFVPSSLLLSELPWETAWPDHDNLKHLVRRVRRILEDTTLQIESRKGFGYRITVA